VITAGSIGHYWDQLQTLAYVGIAMALGGTIGFERERKDRPALLRTHMLVSGAAALFVALADVVLRGVSGVLGAELVRSDPIRIIGAVVVGSSLLAAGTILLRRARGQVEGLRLRLRFVYLSSGRVCGLVAIGAGDRRDGTGGGHSPEAELT
jgi:putative Mg2+ transporter-C (MgtC) family protein